MADASDTMRYLVKQIDIAPAGTREEGQAAKSLSEVFHEHGLETANKSFRFSSMGKTFVALLAGVVGVAGILSGVSGGVLPVIMLVLGLVASALYVLEVFGVFKTVSRIGPAGSSQNVVARHPAATTVNGQKARPVVVIAHYDTPRADLLSIPAIAPVKPYLPAILLGCMAVDVVAMFLQILPLPQVVLNVAWAVAIVASIVPVLWAINAVLHRFAMPFTVGANDNKASVAAVFGLLDRVRPLQGGQGFGPDDALYAEQDLMSSEPQETAVDLDSDVSTSPVRRRRVPRGGVTVEEEAAPRSVRREPALKRPVRYGATVVRELGILPESCVIEYVEAPSSHVASVHRASEAHRSAQEEEVVEGSTVVMSLDAMREGADDASRVIPAQDVTVTNEPGPAVAEQDDKDAAADAIMADIVGNGVLSGSAAPEPDAVPVPAPAAATSLMQPVQVQPEPPRQAPFKVITSSDDYDVELLNTPVAMPPDVAEHSAQVSTAFSVDDPDIFSAGVVNDPSWGTSTFTPVSAGRRILSDIPDPAVAAVDPFSVTSIEPVGGYNPEDFSSIDFETGTHQALTPHMIESERRRALDGFSAEITDQPKRSRKAKKGRQGRISHQAARMQAELQEESFNDWLGLDEDFDARTGGQEIGSWDNFADDQSIPGAQGLNGDQYGSGDPRRWQGGAARARRGSRRSSENGAPEVRRAAMTLGDRELIAHEIWFVLTGASEADHAGVEDFLHTYRNDLRGAYFVNLECIGVGRDALVLEEGLGRHTKADRRLVNLFGGASTNINRPLALTRMNWRDTEATPLLRQGCRAVTVCGMDRGVPANARWVGDTPEKVDPAMIDDVVDMVVEVIKNA